MTLKDEQPLSFQKRNELATKENARIESEFGKWKILEMWGR